MESETRQRLMRFAVGIDFPNVRKEWIDLFDREYANAGEIKPMIDEVVNDDASVYAGVQNGAFVHRTIGGDLSGSMMDVVIFIVYLWWRKNVLNDPNIASDFPEEL